MFRRKLHSSVRPFVYDRRGALVCDRVQVASLAEKYGTPLYLYSADAIGERLELFRRAFSGIDHLVCYAVKANSNLSILRLMFRAGAGFDIVSGGELARVLRAGGAKAARRTVFSGVGKTAAEIDAALRARILLFNVESEGELDLLAARAARSRIRAPIALRVNPDVFAETHPYISTGLREHKFGIDIRRAPELYRRAAASPNLEPVGISVHIGSQIRSAEPFGAAAERIATLARDLRREGIAIRFLDAGGGLGIDYHQPLAMPAGFSHAPGENAPTQPASFCPAAAVDAYAAALRSAFSGVDSVRLLLEPGRFLVAQAGALFARVLYVKQNGGKRFVITDAAMNDLIRPALYGAHHEIIPAQLPRVAHDAADQASDPSAGAESSITDITGPVCETGDFFARDRSLPPVAPGDVLAILDVGAYGMSLASNYNSRPRPAEVLIEGRRTRVIRRRETVEDLLRGE